MLDAPLFITGTPRIVRFFDPMETELFNNRKLDDLLNKILFNTKPKRKKVLQPKRKKYTFNCTIRLSKKECQHSKLYTYTKWFKLFQQKNRNLKIFCLSIGLRRPWKCCQKNFLTANPRSHHVHGVFDKSKGNLSNMSMIFFYNFFL